MKFAQRSSLAIGAVLAVAALVPTSAAATADNCEGSGVSGGATSCVKVVGDSTYVKTVAGGVGLMQRQSFKGVFHVWGSGFSRWTATYSFHNPSYVLTGKFFGPAFTINRNLPHGSTVCAEAIRTSGVNLGTACVLVKR